MYMFVCLFVFAHVVGITHCSNECNGHGWSIDLQGKEEEEEQKLCSHLLSTDDATLFSISISI